MLGHIGQPNGLVCHTKTRWYAKDLVPDIN
jgi:hypothetical protein